MYQQSVVTEINAKLETRSGKSAGAITAELIETR